MPLRRYRSGRIRKYAPSLTKQRCPPTAGASLLCFCAPGKALGSESRQAAADGDRQDTSAGHGPPAAQKGWNRPKNGRHPARNFNIYNFPLHSAGCFRETKKHLRKTIRHLKKTTKHLEKIIQPVVTPSSGLFFGKSGQKENEEALYLREVLGLLMQIYNIFQRKANRSNCILTFQPRKGELIS